MSFALTIVNDSLLLYDIFGTVDSLEYVRTNEFGKYIFYTGNNPMTWVDVFYYYSTNKIEFWMDGENDSGLFVRLRLSTP